MKNKSFKPVLNFVRYLTQPVFVLLWTTITVYAVFFPLLGFYWDDLAIQWISEVYGTAGLAKYFSTNRPVWGLFYQLNTSLLGKEPWLWQIFGIFWRWVASVGLYFVLKEFWQDRKEPAMLGAAFFIIYPSFGGQFIATVFGHFFLVLSAYFFSLYFSLKALRSAERRTLHTVLALLLSAVNVFSMEYFFMLELLRPILFFVYYIRQPGNWKTRIKPVLLKWLTSLPLKLSFPNDRFSIPYILFYPTVRVGDVFDTLEPDLDFSHDLLIGEFIGNTSDAVAIYYKPPGCLRVLDPEIEGDNWMVSRQVRDYIHLSDPSRILQTGDAQPPVYLYAPEPSQNWCYYFQKADLARQYGDWETVVALGETAFSLDDNPNDPAERFPFIEGYAHTGNWQRALELSNETAAITPVIHSSLCNLWQRIETETEKSEVQTETLQTFFKSIRM